MPSLRLTRRAIDEIPFAQKGQVLYRDTILPGFGLRVGAQSKVFFAEGQVQRRTRRVTIGRADIFARGGVDERKVEYIARRIEGGIVVIDRLDGQHGEEPPF